MAVTSQSTLKELVDETTVIKDELVNCRNTLKTNLNNKGVDTTSLNKINDLISSIPNMPVKRWASGTGNYSSYILTVNNLEFKPSHIFVKTDCKCFYSTFFSETESYIVDSNSSYRKVITITKEGDFYFFKIFCSAFSSSGGVTWVAFE